MEACACLLVMVMVMEVCPIACTTFTSMQQAKKKQLLRTEVNEWQKGFGRVVMEDMLH